MNPPPPPTHSLIHSSIYASFHLAAPRSINLPQLRQFLSVATSLPGRKARRTVSDLKPSQDTVLNVATVPSHFQFIHNTFRSD
jgi:hypothetical protein